MFRKLILWAACAATLCSATVVFAEKLGSVHAGTYGAVTYEEIPDIRMSARQVFSMQTYDIVVPGTQPGEMIVCALIDTTGAVILEATDNSLSHETALHFSTPVANATARCFYARAERLTRPSGSP